MKGEDLGASWEKRRRKTQLAYMIKKEGCYILVFTQAMSTAASSK